MLDLNRCIEGQRGKLGTYGAQDFERVAGAVQEIGVAKGNMLRAHLDLRANILKDELLGDNEETSLVDRRNRTVQAGVQAAPACLGIADHREHVTLLESGVALKG